MKCSHLNLAPNFKRWNSWKILLIGYYRVSYIMQQKKDRLFLSKYFAYEIGYTIPGLYV
jgi:hypothetical protein